MADITGRKALKKELVQAQAHIESILSNVTDVHILFDREWRYIYVNEAAIRRIGRLREEILGRTLWELYPDIVGTELDRQYHRAMDQHLSVIFDFYYPTTDTWWENRFYPAPEGLAVFASNITERKKAEEALRESEERYRHLVKHAPAGIYEVDFTTLKLLSVNDAMCQYTGYTREEFLSMDPMQLHTEESLKSLIQRHAKILAGEPVPDNIEYQLKRKDGSEFWVLLNNRFSYGPNNRILATVIAHDITERRQAEEALRQTERNFHRSMDESPLGVRIVTIEGETIYANRAILDIYGYDSIEELRATPIVNRYTPESFAEYQIRREERRRGHYYPSEYDINIVKKDGEVRHLHVFRKEILWDGERQFQVLYSDITERKRLEELLKKERQELKLIIDSSPIIVFYKDKEGKFIRVNKAFAEVLKLPEGEFVGKTVFDLFPTKIAEGMTNDDREVIKSGHPKLNITEQYESSNGIRWVQTDKIPICDKNGIPFGLIGFAQDITERKQAEEALRESEARFAKIFNASPVAIAITRLNDSHLIDVNLAWQKVTGYTREEVIDRTPFELNTWVNRSERDQLISIIRQQGIVRDFLFQLRHKSGTVLEMLMSAELIELAGERYMLSLAQDITERRHTEKALRESEIKYRGLYESTQDGIAMADIKGHFIECNRAFLDMLGYTKKEIKNMTYQQTTPVKWRDMERNIVINKILKMGYSDVYEKEYIRRDGTVFPVSMRVWAAKDDAGIITGLWAIIRDITERKQAEEALHAANAYNRSLIEASLDPLVTIGPDGRITDVNTETETVTGYTRAELIGKDFSDYFTEPEKAHAGYREVFRKGSLRGYPLEIRHRDGHITSVLYNASVYQNDAGDVVGVFAAARDITERKQAEESIKVSRQQLRALAGRLQSAREEQRKQIAREIHDELGGALTALKIDLSSLANSVPKSRDKTKRDSFLSKILEMSKLIDETIGTVRRLVTELRPSILDDFGLLAALEWQLQEFEKRTGIQTEFASNLECINIEEELSTALFRIFQESLTNVARHADATKVTVTLYKEADSLVLKVEDNGKGISAADIHDMKSVGLVGMRERALFLGGTVNISAEPSKGTTVSVQFPFRS